MRKLTLILLGLLAIGCTSSKVDPEVQRIYDAPMYVESVFNDDADLSQYKTFSYIKAGKSGDTRIDDAGFRYQIGTTVGAQLEKRGFTHVESGGDMIVSGHAAIEGISSDTLNEFYASQGYKPVNDRKATRWQKGTLIIFIFDAETRGLIYNGQAQAEVGKPGSQEMQDARVTRAVELLMEKMPSRPNA